MAKVHSFDKIPSNFFRSPNDDDDRHLWYAGDSNRGPQPNLYPHNTYHGPSPHYRTPLNPADFKPLRFTDSPQHYFGLKTSPGHLEPSPQPVPSLAKNSSTSGLRRSSNGSSDEEVREDCFLIIELSSLERKEEKLKIHVLLSSSAFLRKKIAKLS